MTALNPLKKIGAHLTEVLMRYRKLNKKQAREEAIEALRKVGIPSLRSVWISIPMNFQGHASACTDCHGIVLQTEAAHCR